MTVEHSSQSDQEQIFLRHIGEPRDLVESPTVVEQFAAIVSQFPDREAMKTVDASCTFEELDKLSNRTANAVLTDGADGAEPVVLISGRGISAVSGILGILKAGRFYVPL